MRIRRRNLETGEYERLEVSVPQLLTFWLTRGLSRSQIAGALIIAQRLFVVVSLALILGFMTTLGFPSPFAWASEVAKQRLLQEQKIAQVQQDTAAIARVVLGNEIVSSMRKLCTITDGDMRNSFTRYIDGLQRDYVRITGSKIKEVQCLQRSPQ